jgi:acetyl-CoA C-acetyltransferase
MQRKLTMESMAAPVDTAITLYDCCPITDGAAAVIIASEDFAKRFNNRWYT